MSMKGKIFVSIIMIALGFLIASCALSPGSSKSSSSSSSSSISSSNTYKLIYDANGAKGGTVPTDNNSYQIGSSVTIASNTGNLVNPGYNFAGWTASTNGQVPSFAGGAVVTIPTNIIPTGISSNITLYAVWITNILLFNSSGMTIAITGYSTSPSGSLTIPAGVTSISKYAFGSSSLTAVNIPSSITNIDDCAFFCCTALINITVDNGNSYYKSISGILFNKTGTTLFQAPGGMVAANYTIPTGVTSIGNYAFAYCFSLAGTITIPSGVTSIGDSAFYSCSSLSGNLTIPSSVTNIGASAFSDCNFTGAITIPAGVINIGNSAFYGCPITSIAVASGNNYYTSISGVLFNYSKTTLLQAPVGMVAASYTIPSSVVNIADSAFAFCTHFTGTITIPSGVTNIDNNAFINCTSLTGVIFSSPDTLKRIGNSAFQNCSGLTGSIQFPSTVTSVGTYAFNGCSGLSSVNLYFVATIPALPVNSHAFDGEGSGFCITVSDVPSYQSTTGWSDYSSILSPG